LMCEKETLGLFLTGHPIDRFLDELKLITTCRLKYVQPTSRGTSIIISGLVIGIRTIRTKSGGHMAILTLDDRTSRFDAMLYTEANEEFSQLLVKDKILIVEGEVSFDDFNDALKMTVRQVMDIPSARERFSNGVWLEVLQQDIEGNFAEQLSKSLEPYRDGDCPVTLKYLTTEESTHLTLPSSWCISPTDDLISRLNDLPGCSKVEVKYQ
jgi:DNA polymerase-3 subunit alpha